MTLLVPQNSSESLSHILGGSDLLNEEFRKWFTPILRGKGQFRVKRGCELFDPIATKSLSELIVFLELFTQKKLVCGIVHETGKQVIELVTGKFVTLTESNCNIQVGNPACGHPEMSGLAQAIFIAERLIGNRLYTRGFGLLNTIIGFDADIGGLAETGIYNKSVVITRQEKIACDIVAYLQELVEKLREKSIEEEEKSA